MAEQFPLEAASAKPIGYVAQTGFNDILGEAKSLSMIGSRTLHPSQAEINAKAMEILAKKNYPANASGELTKTTKAALPHGPSVFREAAAAGGGVVSTFLTSWGISQGLQTVERYLPLHPLAKTAIGIGSGLLVGGMVNNGVSGRDLLEAKGYIYNAGYSAATYTCYQLARDYAAKSSVGLAMENRLLTPSSPESAVPVAKMFASQYLHSPLRSLCSNIVSGNGVTVEFSSAARTAEIMANSELMVLKVPEAITAEAYAEADAAAAYTGMMFEDHALSKAAESAASKSAGGIGLLLKHAGAVEVKPGVLGVSFDVKKAVAELSQKLTGSSPDAVQAAFKEAQAFYRGETALFNDYSRALLSRFGPVSAEARQTAVRLLQDTSSFSSPWLVRSAAEDLLIDPLISIGKASESLF